MLLDFFGIEDKAKEDTAEAELMALHAPPYVETVKEQVKPPDPVVESRDGKAVEKKKDEGKDLPVIVLAEKPQFDPTHVAEHIQEAEKKALEQDLATKTLQELAQEANQQRTVILKDNVVPQ